MFGASTFLKSIFSVNRGNFRLNGQYLLVLRESQNRASKLEMNISNSKPLIRAFCSDLDSDFVSEITQRGLLLVNSSYGATTSICARNVTTFPSFQVY